jgi:hypothetical protein
MTNRSRRLAALLTVLVATFLTACVPTDRSVVTPDVLTFDPALAGEWNSGKSPADRVTFTKAADGKSYVVATYDDDGKQKENTSVFRTMKIGSELFYELQTRNPGDTRDRFAVGRLTVEKDRLRGWGFEKDDAALDLPDVKTTEVDYGSDKQKVLAMEPAKVQAFLKTHAKELTKETFAVSRGRAGK